MSVNNNWKKYNIYFEKNNDGVELFSLFKDKEAALCRTEVIWVMVHLSKEIPSLNGQLYDIRLIGGS